jgi:hypothetical protein
MEPDGVTRVYSSHHQPLQATTRYPVRAYSYPQFVEDAALEIIQRADFRCVAVSQRIAAQVQGQPDTYQSRYSCYEGANGYEKHFEVDSTSWNDGDDLPQLVSYLEKRAGKTGLTILAS